MKIKGTWYKVTGNSTIIVKNEGTSLENLEKITYDTDAQQKAAKEKLEKEKSKQVLSINFL